MDFRLKCIQKQVSSRNRFGGLVSTYPLLQLFYFQAVHLIIKSERRIVSRCVLVAGIVKKSVRLVILFEFNRVVRMAMALHTLKSGRKPRLVSGIHTVHHGRDTEFL